MTGDSPMPDSGPEPYVRSEVFSGFRREMSSRLDRIDDTLSRIASGRGTNWSVLLSTVAMMGASMIWAVTVYVEPLKETISKQKDEIFRLHAQQLDDARWQGSLDARVSENEKELDSKWLLLFEQLQNQGEMRERTRWLEKTLSP